jgi:hypothetical protein
LCQYETLTATASGGAFYTWYLPTHDTIHQQNFEIEHIGIEYSGWYKVHVMDLNQCWAVDSTFIEIYPVLYEMVQDSICPDEPYLLPGGYYVYGEGVYIDSMFTVHGCDSIYFTWLSEKPTADLWLSSNSPICIGSNLNLMANTTGSVSWTGPNSFLSSDLNPVIAEASQADSGWYKVYATSGNGCITTDSLLVVVHNCEGIGTLGANVQVSVSPVPFNNELILRMIGNRSEILTVKMLDVLGNKVLEEKVALLQNQPKEIEIDGSNLAAGSYLVVFIGEQGFKTYKVSKL